ncbi:MAG: bifunctional UDP-N-acetylglucosamine diphosphorylase/glucosamine-1-phosphate N-acetyltransferase GlmU [Endomicrobium sp.]|jgi:bifunctional UDP-N-acetylglucosamine pyrophosphorylase/glucosamine-1-phosphate N-acetyltransferase|nr:bifunctional UDP-N-acetylglucosamine diphosphorylase/glucosamine-1-phosphate N-acetyltransferase GlmU [Endomicrobium sp.]
MKNFSVVILAAGAGKRMKSSLPKVMHELSGKPLLKWVIDSVSVLRPDNLVLVLGWRAEFVGDFLAGSDSGDIKVVYQKEQLGSGHALMQAWEILRDYRGDILVLNADVPLIKSSTLLSLIENNRRTGASATVLVARTDNPFGYGRVIIKNGSCLEKIVEEKDATTVEKRIKEINSGVYCFDKNLWRALLKLKPDNVREEYYITDTIAVLRELGKKVSSVVVEDSCEVKGINTRIELSEVERMLKEKKIKELLDDGVTIIDTDNVYISYDAKIGIDSIIYPGVFIGIGVSIGKNCIIKGSSYIRNSRIGDASTILYSYVEDVVVNEKVKIGPFSHIRQNSVLKKNVKVGNFSEVKESVVSENSKIGHLSYIGDSQVGEGVNIGAGTITCNYDGIVKHETVIGSRSFIGSNVNLVAPVRIGESVFVAAGSTITHDVPSGKLAIGRVRQEIKKKSGDTKNSP